MNTKHIFHLKVLIVTICLITFSCKDPSVGPISSPVNDTLTFSSINPNYGIIGSIVQIKGNGFRKFQTVVLFDSLSAEIISINDTIMDVRVPIAKTGLVDVSVFVDSNSAVCKNCFQIMYDSNSTDTLAFFSINPNHGRFGSIVQIKGQGFAKDLPVVLFDSQSAKIISINDTIIQVRVPNTKTGLVDVSISVDSNSATLKKSFVMTESDFYFTKASVSLTNIGGNVVNSSYSGTPGNYQYKDTSYPTTNFNININIIGYYRGDNQILPFRLSYFTDSSICIAAQGYYSNNGSSKQTKNYYISFLIDTASKVLKSFEAVISESASNYNDGSDNTQILKLDNIPFAFLSNGDIMINYQGKQIKNYFVEHYYNNSSQGKFNGYSYGLKDFTIQDNSILTIKLLH